MNKLEIISLILIVVVILIGIYFIRRALAKDKDSENYESQEEEQAEADTYSYFFDCDNCSICVEADIPKGIKKEEYLRNKRCSECGCSFEEQFR